MRISIRSRNLKVDKDLENYINDKISAVEKFINQPENDFQIWVDVERLSHHHKKGLIFKAEAQMFLSGKEIVAKAISDDIRTAVVELKNELQIEIKKDKKKKGAIRKRAALLFKKIIRLSPLALLKKEKKEGGIDKFKKV